MTKTDKEQLRQRIQWLKDALAVCCDPRQRESLIERLLDTQDQLMFLNLEPSRRLNRSPAGPVAATLRDLRGDPR